MPWRIAVLVLLGMLGAGAAAAQPATDDAAICLDFDEPADPQIAACTRLIEAGDRPAAELAQFHVERGFALDRDQAAEAIADFTAAIALDPGNAEAFFGRGYYHYLAERYEEAATDYAVAATIEPFGFRYYDLATAWYQLGRTAEAMAALDTALEISPTHTSSLYLRGWLRENSGDHDAALADFTRLTELSPMTARYQEALGTVRYRLGDTTEALRALAAAVLLDPNLGNARYALEELTPPRPAEDAGPLVFRAPPAGMRITFIEVIGETPPVLDPMEEAIRGLIGFFATETNYPEPDVRRAAIRDFGATVERSTEITTTILYDGDQAPVSLPHLYGLWQTAFPPGGPALTLVYDQGLSAFWKMAPGDSVDVGGQVMFPCPERTNPIGVMLGCTAGLATASVGDTTFTARFEGWEYVVVPAGQRLAARVAFTETRRLTLFGETATNSVEGVWWIDPELGFWIKRQQSQDGETQTIAAWTIELPQ